MAPLERMDYERYRTQAEVALSCTETTAQKESENLRHLGRHAVITALFRPNIDPINLFWAEIRWKVSAGDTIGPYSMERSDGSLARGLAVWTPARVSPGSGVE